MLLTGFVAPALAQEHYMIDPLHTAATFSVAHLGLSQQRGSFGRTTGTVTLDRAAHKGSIEVSIDASTVTSGSPSREALLKGEDYFNVAQFPNITFKSVNLRFEGDAVVGADGELTMRGISRPVALSVADFKCAVHPATPRHEEAGVRCRGHGHRQALRIRHDQEPGFDGRRRAHRRGHRGYPAMKEYGFPDVVHHS